MYVICTIFTTIISASPYFPKSWLRSLCWSYLESSIQEFQIVTVQIDSLPSQPGVKILIDNLRIGLDPFVCLPKSFPRNVLKK